MIAGKLEFYAIVFVAAVCLAVGAFGYGHHNGYTAAIDDTRVQVAKANDRIDATQQLLNTANERYSNDLQQIRTHHEEQYATALSNVKPVIVRVPASSGGGAPAQTGASITPVDTTSTATAAGSAVGGVLVERDISSALVMLSGACDEWRDAAVGWQGWWDKQVASGKF